MASRSPDGTTPKPSARRANQAVRSSTMVTSTPADDVTNVIVEDRHAWFELLADGFGIVPADPDALWARVHRAHEEWAATQG